MGQPSKTTVDQGGKTIVCKTDNFVPLVVPRLSTSSGSNSSSTSTSQDLSSTSPAQERSDELATRELCGSPSKTKKIKRGMAVEMRMTVSEIFLNGWMSFTDNPEDTEVQAPAHISQDSDSERPTKVVSKSRKHSIYTHFPNDRNCEVCLRTQITRALCRRSTGEALPQAKNFGDLITADHKFLNEGCESRDNCWYAVVVQVLATQWIQSQPCKTKSSHETEKSLLKFLEPSQAPKVVFTDNRMEFWKAPWYHRTSTPHRSETNGIAERAVRRVKEGT